MILARCAGVRELLPGGNVPYGYQRNGKALVPDPAEAEIIRMIFELTERGETPSGIARTLSDKGLERRNRKPWTQRQVSATLQRQAFYRSGVIRSGEVSGQNSHLALLE